MFLWSPHCAVTGASPAGCSVAIASPGAGPAPWTTAVVVVAAAAAAAAAVVVVVVVVVAVATGADEGAVVVAVGAAALERNAKGSSCTWAGSMVLMAVRTDSTWSTEDCARRTESASVGTAAVELGCV
jgi:hypothetical protein